MNMDDPDADQTQVENSIRLLLELEPDSDPIWHYLTMQVSVPAQTSLYRSVSLYRRHYTGQCPCMRRHYYRSVSLCRRHYTDQCSLYSPHHAGQCPCTVLTMQVSVPVQLSLYWSVSLYSRHYTGQCPCTAVTILVSVPVQPALTCHYTAWGFQVLPGSAQELHRHSGLPEGCPRGYKRVPSVCQAYAMGVPSAVPLGVPWGVPGGCAGPAHPRASWRGAWWDPRGA